jgi:hypothetical protein
VTGELRKRDAVVTELIDIAELPIRVDGAGGDVKDPVFSEKMERAEKHCCSGCGKAVSRVSDRPRDQ